MALSPSQYSIVGGRIYDLFGGQIGRVKPDGTLVWNAEFDPSTSTINAAGSTATQVFTGATSGAAGKVGELPAPVAGQQDANIKGGGDWDKTDRRTLVTLANQAANVTLPAASTVDACSVLELNQSTASITITLPSPTASKARVLTVINCGSVAVTVNSTSIAASGAAIFAWSPSGAKWIKVS